jgi:O-succinylbenzoic acid--CoA ligase
MGKIIIQNKTYRFEAIQQGIWQEEDPYFHQVLAFCQGWLNGVKSFEITTSGSTGKPKDILMQRKQMEVSSAATRSFFQVTTGARLLCCLNTWMVAGKMMLVRGLEWDAEIHVVKPGENPLLGLEGLIFDFVAMVPMQVAAALSDKKSLPPLKNIKALLIGGANSSPTLLQQITAQGLTAYQTYGMTETVSHIALAKINGPELIYRILPGVKIGTDAAQRLWVKAPMAAAEKLQTNDLVEIIDGERFKWLGRADFTINSGGIKLQPELMEPKMTPAFESIFGHAHFFLHGKEDEKLGQKLVLIIQGSHRNTEKERELLDQIKTLFDRYHLPKEIHYAEAFKRTQSGKINRPETFKNCL